MVYKESKNVIIFSLLLLQLILGFNVKSEEENNLMNKNASQSLTLPFLKGEEVKITEGWIYSEEEKSIHGIANHQAIDYSGLRGTPVLASADGYAVSTSQIAYLSRIYQGKRVGYGYGNYVIIWHPEKKLYTLYAHLEQAAPDIPYFQPEERSYGGWGPPPTLSLKPEDLLKNAKFVKKGELIGWMGDSGLSWGYDELPRLRPDPICYPSWDEPHLHFEVFTINAEGKKVKLDPYGIYGTAEEYKDVKL